MKILKVLGIVVALHVVAYLVIMSPGCRSTATRPEPGPTPAAVTATPAPAHPPGSDFAPGPVELQPISLNMPVAQTAPGGDRQPPTRPGPAADSLAGTVTPAKTYIVQKGDTLAGIARKNGLTAASLAAANNIATTGTLHIGQKLVVPGKAAPSGAATPAAPATASPAGTYTVKSGDTLGKIAARHGTTTAALRTLNSISGDMLKIGQVLKVPGAAGSSPAQLPPPAAVSPASGSPVAVAAGSGTHTVALNESLEGIARRYGLKMADLAKANAITDPRKLRAGQVLVIPGAAGARAAPPPPSLVPESSARPVAPVVEPAVAVGDAPVVRVEEAPPAVPVPN